MKFCLIIPSYWGRRSGEPFCEEDAVYDHPTPLDSEGTLARALESVCLLDYEDLQVVVVGAATHPDLEADAEERLRGIVAPFRRRLRLALLSHSHLRRIQAMLGERGEGEAAEMLSLRGYPNIRNFCLAAARLADADAAVFFDDDQVYEDPDYLKRVASHIGGEHRGRFVGGLAGYYVNADGGYLVPASGEWAFAEWPAAEAMNEAFRMVEAGEELQVTPWVLGGNMVVHRELYARVAFDPLITRGEDIDYLINARLVGYDFFLDSRLRIRHLPPPKSAPLWRRFREDLDRFIYTREKLRRQEPGTVGSRIVSVEELDPYPGRFLRDDLEEMIFKTCILMGLDYLSREDREGFEQCMANIRRARLEARPSFDPYRRYMDFRGRWERLMGLLDGVAGMREYVTAIFDE
jgi:GT2 family glycosyltransferase